MEQVSTTQSRACPQFATLSWKPLIFKHRSAVYIEVNEQRSTGNQGFAAKVVELRTRARFLRTACVIALMIFGTPSAFGATAKKEMPIDELQRFTTVIEHIKNYYVQPVEDTELFESAIRGMLAGLDPHSTYLDKDEFAELKVSTSGKFGGLGIEVTLEDGFVRVISPIDDTPADRAGIHAGDLIIRLDDTPIKGLSLRDAVEKMRGKQGSKIILTVLREGEAKPLQFTLVRAVINVHSVKSKMLEDNYGYIRISQFQNDTGDELIQLVKNLQKENKKNLKGLVLDLRNNPGGVLDTSVQIADAFLDATKLKNEALIVYTKGRLPGSQIKEVAHKGDLLNGAPLVVLVNGGSASASEIVAGALQDHHRAIIMGTKTFGKGSVQTILPLKDQRGLKLTTALYYTPSGRSIQATGIEPDIMVEPIKMPSEQKNEELSALLLRESDLAGHLETNHPPKQKSEAADSAQKQPTDDELLKTDYQLHEALNLLKGLNFFSPKAVK